MQKLMCLLLGLSLSVALTAQDGDWMPENDQIRAQRAAYITQRLQLTSEEAAHFWPLFNEYEAEKTKLKQTFRHERIQPTTEAEADALIRKRLAMEKEVLQLKTQLYERAKTKVPALKLMLLNRAETEFKRDLLRQLRSRRRG